MNPGLKHQHAKHAMHLSHGMPPRTGAAHMGHDRHAGHSVAMFRDKFWPTLILTVPVVAWSGEFQHWLGYTAPTFPASQYIPAFLGTTVFLYGGSVFIRGAWGELADRRPGMMTLISLGMVVAFVASLAATLGFFKIDVWWEVATLITVMLLGHWLEMKAIAQARRTLERPPTRLQRAQYLNHSIQLVRPAPRYASHRIGISTLRVQSWPATVIHTIRILPALNFRFAIHPIFSSKLAISYVRRTVIQRTRRDGRTASPTRGITNLEVFTTPGKFPDPAGNKSSGNYLIYGMASQAVFRSEVGSSVPEFPEPTTITTECLTLY
jgi:hypothetical protein